MGDLETLVLAEPALYTPWLKGVLDMSPGMKLFGTDFGNGEADQRLFQVDREWKAILENKLEIRRQRREWHIGRSNLSPEVESAAIEFLRDRFLTEWPGYTDTAESVMEESESELDRWVSILPGDVALVEADETGADRVSYLNICAPSHWDPREKLGQSFFAVHVPVPGFERANSGAKALVEAMVSRGPWVRFVWGLETDTRLNHHPSVPSGWDPEVWNGRQFDREPMQIRFERQITWPLPSVRAALFFIRVGFVPMDRFWSNPDWQRPMRAALKGMSENIQQYKGIHGQVETILAKPEWLV